MVGRSVWLIYVDPSWVNPLIMDTYIRPHPKQTLLSKTFQWRRIWFISVGTGWFGKEIALRYAHIHMYIETIILLHLKHQQTKQTYLLLDKIKWRCARVHEHRAHKRKWRRQNKRPSQFGCTLDVLYSNNSFLFFKLKNVHWKCSFFGVNLWCNFFRDIGFTQPIKQDSILKLTSSNTTQFFVKNQ